MNLVGYSDSEGSDSETAPLPKIAPRAAPITAAPKLVDPSTHKVKINLASLGGTEEQEPEPRTAKRQRTGGDFNINAFLPPPKQPLKQFNHGSASSKRAPGRGLGSGVNLKTGAEPAFERKETSTLDLGEEPKDIKEIIAELRRSSAPKDGAGSADARPTPPAASPSADATTKPTNNFMRFKPKSVARAAPKKKVPIRPAVEATAAVATSAEAPATLSKPRSVVPAKKKSSLFSIGQQEAETVTSRSTGEYQPEFTEDTDIAEAEENNDTFEQTVQTPSAPQPQNVLGLEGVDLSEADMRQLFGRKGLKGAPDLSSIKMVDFNTDTEYANNEALRANGDSVQHNPVRGVAPGKHTLKQLVNAAATQKDALEEHFAMGKRNKAEAGNKYGW